MMTEEGAVRAHQSECPSLSPFKFGTQGFTIIFQQKNVPTTDDPTNLVKIIWVSEEVDGEYHSRFVRHCLLELLEIDIQRLAVDIDELQPESVLIQRIVRCRPRYSGHNNLITTF